MRGVFAYVMVGEERGIWCAHCGVVSCEPRDVEQRYCAGCDAYMDTEIGATGAGDE
jgi:hypothetical protein